VPIIFIGVTLKWLIRFFLIGFYGVTAYYYSQGQNILLWLAQDHPWVTVGIIVLTVMAFLFPFFHIKRKTKDGGEADMRKLAWFVLIAIAVTFGISVACALNDPFKFWVSKSLTGLGGAIWINLSTAWSNLAVTIGASGTYFLVYTLGTLLFGGILLVMLTRVKNSGKLPSLHKKTMSETPSGFDSGMRSSTPVGATTRPAANPAPLPEVEVALKEVKEA